MVSVRELNSGSHGINLLSLRILLFSRSRATRTGIASKEGYINEIMYLRCIPKGQERVGCICAFEYRRLFGVCFTDDTDELFRFAESGNMTTECEL